MTNGTGGGEKKRPSKKEILQSIARRRLTMKQVAKAAECTSKKLASMKLATGAILYLYLCFFGVIYDLVFYGQAHGLDPFKYANLEDFVFSVVKHWDVTLVVVAVMFAALAFLMFLWNAFVNAAWIICYSTPEQVKEPPRPARPNYRQPKSVYSNPEGARVWREFRYSVGTTVSDRTTRGWSNLRPFFKFLREIAYYRLVGAISVLRKLLLKEDVEELSKPTRPDYEAPSLAPPTEAGNKTWRQLWSDFRKTVSRSATCTWSNLWMSVEFGLARTIQLLMWTISRSCNGLITLYSLIARLPEKLLRPVGGLLIVAAGLVCFVGAPTLGAVFMAQGTQTDSVGEEGLLCTRQPDGCELVNHIGSTAKFAFFRTKEPPKADTGPTLSFATFGKTRELLFDQTDKSTRPEVIAVPLINIASFRLHGTEPDTPNGPIALTELKEALDKAKTEILARIDRMAGGTGGRAKALNLKDLNVAIKNNNAAIIEGVAKITGVPVVEPGLPPSKSISLAELKTSLDNSASAILDRVGAVDDRVTSHSQAATVANAKVETSLDKGKREILARLGTVDRRVTGHFEAAAVAASRMEKAFDDGKRDILERVDGVGERVYDTRDVMVEQASKVTTALDHGKREILARFGTVDRRVTGHFEAAAVAASRMEKAFDDGRYDILERVDGVGERVYDTRDVVVEQASKVTTALDDGKREILDRIEQFERDRPPSWYDLVTRYIVINRTETQNAEPRVETRNIYSLAGFNEGKDALVDFHKEWIKDFGEALRQCSLGRPQFRIIGYSSAQPFEGTVKTYPNLCKPENDPGDATGSDRNNCLLANHRASQVASAILRAINDETIVPKREWSKESILGSMNEECAKSATGSVRRSSFMRIEPWCVTGDMKRRRFDTGFGDVSKQPNFLNRGVHIVIENTENCPGF